MGLEAYRRAQKVTESPRETEYRLFSQITGALIKAKDSKAAGAALVDVLDWNRRLWSTLASDCASPGNALPQELRAQIISLGLWVSRYSSDVAIGRGDIDDLIEVNRAIMEGLAMRPNPPSASASISMSKSAA